MLFIVKCNKKLNYKNNYSELYLQYYKCIELFEKNVSNIDSKERDRDFSFILYYIANCGFKLIFNYLETMKIENLTKTKSFDESFIKSLEVLPIFKFTNTANKTVINNSICIECGNSFTPPQQPQPQFYKKCQLCGVIYHLECFSHNKKENDNNSNLYCKNCEFNKSKKYWDIYRILINSFGIIKYSLQLNQYNSRSTYLLMDFIPKLWRYIIQIYPKYSLLENEYYNLATSLLLSKKKKKISDFRIYRYDNSYNILDKLDYHQKKYQRILLKYIIMTIIFLNKHNDYNRLISLFTYTHTNYNSQKLYDSLDKSILSSLEYQFGKSNDIKSMVNCLKNYNEFRNIVMSNSIISECNKDIRNIIDVLNEEYKCNIENSNKKTIEKFIKCYDKENNIQTTTETQ